MNNRFNSIAARLMAPSVSALRRNIPKASVFALALNLGGCDSADPDDLSADGSALTGDGSGDVGGPIGNASGVGGGMGSSVDGMGEPAVVVPAVVMTEDGASVDCAALTRPPTPLRRLTRFEYNNTVRDLFSTTSTPADEFPPDEIADGFSNNALVLTVSSLHAERYMVAAESLAAEAAARLSTLLPCDPAAVGEEVCARNFAESFGRRAYRRALEPVDVEALMAAYAVGAGASFERGIEVMIRAVLQSPNFLFRVEFTGSESVGTEMQRLNGFETAARLSFLIWSSIPDDNLLDEAAAGGLDTPEQVATAARRMLADPKARFAVTEFYRQWLGLNRLATITKNVEAFPLWSDAMRAAMEAEGGAVVAEILWGDDPSLMQLLTAPLGQPSGPLAELYGVAEGSAVVSLPETERTGILTLPGFMAVQAHPDQTSPVLRGKFIRTKLLCSEVAPPPDNVDATPPEVSEGTARERFSAHAATLSCANCHRLMDPLGFPFEGYDAVGAFRTTDDGREMDLTGEFVETEELDGPFTNVFEMAQMLSTSEQVSDCVTKQWFKYTMGRGNEDGDACSLSPLQEAFSAGGKNLMELIVSTTQTEAFLYRRASGEEVSP